MLQTVSIESAEAGAEHLSPLQPIGAVAALIARRIAEAKAPLLVYVAETARRRSDIAELVRIMAGEAAVAEFPALDGMPGDGIPPGAEAMGRRMATLRWLCAGSKRPRVVLATPGAFIRRVPPRAVWRNMHLEFQTGEAVDGETVAADLKRIGYRFDDLVNEPGEFAVRGRVLEVFPAAAPRPCRVEFDRGRITAIRSYDPATQRSVAETGHLIVDPASERLPAEAASKDPFLHSHYDATETLFDYAADAEIVMERGADARADEVFLAIEEAGRQKTREAELLTADHLDRREWSARIGGALAAIVEDGGRPADVPKFARGKDPFAHLADFAAPLLRDGYRVVVAGPDRARCRTIARRTARTAKVDAEPAADWAAIRQAGGGRMFFFEASIAEGFLAAEDRIAVVALRDLVGRSGEAGPIARPEFRSGADEAFRIGDAVVHLDHGLAILEGLETVGLGEETTEALRLRYDKDETLLVPLAEIGALWRYGSAASEIKLDRLKGKTWAKRRNAVMEAVSETAKRMVARLEAKAKTKAPCLKPDRAAFERFCARFPYELTPDQEAATGAVLEDLRSGRAMDRLLCGDVGFGKTEVALRAAAAAVFAGRQVAVIAPTTILAQQHFLGFRERFARHGIDVVRLSRLADAKEAAAAKEALRNGSARIVVGTHALLGEDVGFADLALVVIDEEQRFGAKQKAALRALGSGIHVLAMTATPIPQTLAAGFVGLHEVSIVATPPSRRRPVETIVGRFDEAAVREAIAKEAARGGQSFFVCPRIEDLEPMAKRLSALLPDLRIAVLHGELDAGETDDAMLAFANGEYDLLLSTSIVESGLDVPRANTMIVWRADRFGLAQLHQLRGRVGRGSRRGLAILATDPEAEPTPGATERLETLRSLAHLGAGFAIAARDLDLRGAGELLGEEQAGHMQLLGLTLYRRTLERALRVAEGDVPADDWRPDLNLEEAGTVPPDYVPEADLRIEIAIQLERLDDAAALEAFRREVADRFGPSPAPLEAAFRAAKLRTRCRALGIRRLDEGPKAVAASFLPDTRRDLGRRIKPKRDGRLRWSKDRLVLDKRRKDDALEILLELVEERSNSLGR